MNTKREPAAYACSHVFSRQKPILLVSRSDGDWQLVCGDMHDMDERPLPVDLEPLFEADASLRELADLPPEWEAERSAEGEPWVRAQTR